MGSQSTLNISMNEGSSNSIGNSSKMTVISAQGSVHLSGSLNVSIGNMQSLQALGDGSYYEPLIASSSGNMTGMFSNVSVQVQSSEASNSCSKTTYMVSQNYRASSFGITLTPKITSTCDSSLTGWKIAVISVLCVLGVAGIILGVLYSRKFRDKIKRWNAEESMVSLRNR